MATYKKSEATKSGILAAASALFYEKGYYNTTVKDICSKSGVSVSRVNYHFLSKADLAANICGEFLENFYVAVKQFIGNTREYSLLSETIQLRFFVRILLSGEGECPVFYHEIAREGILSEAFSKIAEDKYRRVFRAFHHSAIDETRIVLCAKLYSSALSAIINPRATSSFSCDVGSLMDAYATLFMQIADIQHDVQEAILDKAKQHGQSIGFQLHSLTDIELFPLDPSGNRAQTPPAAE